MREQKAETDGGGEAPAQRYKSCPICGQRFDTENLDHVYHHGPEPHQPLIDEG